MNVALSKLMVVIYEHSSVATAKSNRSRNKIRQTSLLNLADSHCLSSSLVIIAAACEAEFTYLFTKVLVHRPGLSGDEQLKHQMIFL